VSAPPGPVDGGGLGGMRAIVPGAPGALESVVSTPLPPSSWSDQCEKLA